MLNSSHKYDDLDLPFAPNQMNSFKSLEVRLIKAMEQVATLTLEKEQMEYIIGRLQDETGENMFTNREFQ